MPSAYIYPIVVPVPISILNPAVSVPLPSNLEIVAIYGFMQSFISGLFGVNVKDGSGNVLATISWSQAGIQRAVLLDRYQLADQLDFSVTGIGIGAANCYVTVWAKQGMID